MLQESNIIKKPTNKTNMTPKEKAKELYLKFQVPSYCQAKAGMGSDWRRQAAKEYALIAVDEILKAVDSDWSFMQKRIDYWQEVKQEINLL